MFAGKRQQRSKLEVLTNGGDGWADEISRAECLAQGYINTSGVHLHSHLRISLAALPFQTPHSQVTKGLLANSDRRGARIGALVLLTDLLVDGILF